MRSVWVVRLGVLLLAQGVGLLAAQPALLPNSLTDRVRALASQHHGDVALFAENLTTHESIAISPDTPVQTASVIKLAILYEALEQIRNGNAHWSDPITLKPEEQVPGSGVLLFFDTPLQLTFKDALSMMVSLSDNTATNLVIDHLGIARIDERIAALGLKNTYLYKKVFMPVPAGTALPSDFKTFGLGKTTAREMATVMTRLVTCDLGPKEGATAASDGALCAVALHMLHVQFYRNAAPRYLDGLPGAAGDSIANKTGSLNAVRNDVAAVSTRNGLVVLACFTYNNQDQTWGAEQEGELTIAKIAREIVHAWSPEGLAPWPKTIAVPAGSLRAK